MADVSNFDEYSLEECVNYCLLETKSAKFALVSYSRHAILGDKFICACADDVAAFDNVRRLQEMECDQFCPGSGKYKCGDAGDDVLSVYPLVRNPDEPPVCSVRLPHDAHGCVSPRDVDWSHAHNVRNFSAAENDESACVWECHDHHPSSFYALARKITRDILTCSCGYSSAFAPNDHLVRNEFCDMIKPEIDGGERFYKVKCNRDLDENEGEEEGENCVSPLPRGCIYDELIPSSSNPRIVVKPADSARDSARCHRVCAALGKTFTHVGIRYDANDASFECACLTRNSFNESTIGPERACDVDCEPGGTGLICGGFRDEIPAFTVYCLRRTDSESVEVIEPAVLQEFNLKVLSPLLDNIYEALIGDNRLGDVILGLLAVLCLILLIVVGSIFISECSW